MEGAFGLSLVPITAQKMNEKAFAQAERTMYSQSDPNKGSVFCSFQGWWLKHFNVSGRVKGPVKFKGINWYEMESRIQILCSVV